MFLVLSFGGGSGALDSAGRGRRHPAVGQPATGLSLLPLSGPTDKRLELADLQGKVAVVNFWAVWCGPCREELPQLAHLADRMADRPDFQLVPVTYDQLAEDTPEWIAARASPVIKRMGLTASLYADPGYKTFEALKPLLAQGFPTTMVLDKQGVIRAVWSGYSPDDIGRIQTLVEELLSE